MILDVKPVRALQGVIVLPASKSYTIRAFFIGVQARQSVIKNASDCDDALVSQRLQSALRNKAKTFDVGESGTSLRFLLPLLSFLGHPAWVTGKGTLVGRPNHLLCAALRQQGMDISGKGVKESIPIVYKGGELKPGVIKIDGGLSSQFISALLIALPKLNNDSRIVITGTKIVSSDYIKMTRQVLSKAGIKIGAIGQRTLTVKGKQHFKPLVFDVPCDYGLAAFPLSAALLLKSNVVLKGNLDRRLIQSDGHIIAFLKKMGGRFGHTTKAITVKGPSVLKGGIFDLTDCPDLVPIMAVLALFAKGPTKLTGIMHARVKESDRISDLRRELLKVGAKVSETKGTLLITPSPLYKAGQVLNAHHDHRLAMAFTVLGLKIGCRVDGIESCAKSYPGFVKDMKTLGLGRI